MKIQSHGSEEAVIGAVAVSFLLVVAFLGGWWRQRSKIISFEKNLSAWCGPQLVLKRKYWDDRGKSNRLRASLEVAIPTQSNSKSTLVGVAIPNDALGGVYRILDKVIGSLVDSHSRELTVGRYVLRVRGDLATVDRFALITQDVQAKLALLFDLGFRELFVNEKQISLKVFTDALAKTQPSHVVRLVPTVLKEIANHLEPRIN